MKVRVGKEMFLDIIDKYRNIGDDEKQYADKL